MLLKLEQFGFRALWSPYLFLFLLMITCVFFYFAYKKRHLFDGGEKLTKKEASLFILSILFIYIIKGSPLDLLGHLMFTFHMIQMAFLYLLIPHFLIRAIPKWMWERILSFRLMKLMFRFFTKPLIALVLFNGIFSLYHIPIVFDTVKTNVWYHSIYTVILFLLAIFMWWPLVNRMDRENQLSGLKKVAYLFADSVLITPACALIIFSKTPMFETYTNTELWIQSLHLCVPSDIVPNLNLTGPEMFNLMPAHYDQQTGGVIMKVLQELIYGVILYRILMEWYRKEQQEETKGTNFDF